MITVELSSGAEELQSLDDAAMRRELGVELVRRTRRGGVYRMSPEDARRLLDTYRSNHGGGWAFDNPGAMKRAAQSAQRRIEAALASMADPQTTAQRPRVKMVLTLRCGHTLHLWASTKAEHNFNRASGRLGHSAMCAECERNVPVLSAEERPARKEE